MTIVAKAPQHFRWLAIGVLAGAVLAGAADGRDFAGSYDARNLMEAGDAVVLTFAARVFNYSGATVENATVSLENRLDIDAPYGSFAVTSLAADDSVRFDIEVTVPLTEYDAWQAGTTPRLTIAYLDGDGDPVTKHIELAAVRLDEE